MVREVAEACGNGGKILSNSGQLSFLTFLVGFNMLCHMSGSIFVGQ